MKNRAMYCVIIMAIFFISLTGCGTFDKNLGIVQLRTDRQVENNVFTSSFPEIKLQINQNLPYMGRVQLNETPDERISSNTNTDENAVEVTSYLFGKTDQSNRIAEGILIRMLVMHGNPSQIVPEMFTKTGKNVLESGEMKILEEKYQYDLYTEPELFTKAEKEKGLLSNRQVPACFLVKKLSLRAGLGNKSRVQMLYFEDVSNTCGNRPCGACLEPKTRSAEQKQFLQGFTDRSYASIRFLKTKNLEDTTSRYVDVEPKAKPAPVDRMQPAPVYVPAAPVYVPAAPVYVPAAPVYVPAAPVEKAPPVAESTSTKVDLLEKRLEALKRIYEKNLISKEDYEKKKAEILSDL
jgi:hypothetical protein